MPLNPLSRSETAVRLPAPADFHARLLASPVGRLVTRPWFDRVALKLGLAAYLPLSRAWAAAAVSDGSLERFSVLSWALGDARKGIARLRGAYLRK